MAEAQQTTALAPINEPPRTRMVVADVVPIFDTARFMHYGAIAAVLADTWMMPESLTHEGPANDRKVLSGQIIKARAFRIVALADRWNCDPFQLMGAVSFVHNQLMIEGKVIHGVIDAELGVVLDYEFGKWDAATETCLVGEPAAGDMMAVKVSAELAGKVRSIDGSVGVWKTEKGPWKPGAFKRQLRYRGAREWARAHKPSLLIGIIGDDEFDDYRDRRDVAAPVGLDPGFPADQQRLASPQTAETGKPAQRASRARKGPGDAPGGQEGAKSGEDLMTEEWINPETGQVFATKEELLASVRPTEPAQTAEPASDTKASATDASTASPAANSGQQAQDVKSIAGEDEQVEEGVAAPGDVYFLAGETFDEKTGRRTTYKDGKAFSSATRKALDAGDTLVYLNHAPEREEKQGQGESAAAQTAGQQAEGAAAAPSTPSDADSSTDGAVHPFVEAITKIGEAPHWDAAKQAARGASKLETWATDEGGRNMVRSAMWDRYVELRDGGETVPGIVSDLALMGLWLDFGAQSSAEIDGMWRGFFRNASYTGASDGEKQSMNAKMISRRRRSMAEPEPHDPLQVDAKAQLACAKRELAMRRRAYPRFIDKGTMTPKKAGEEIAAMEAIVLTLERRERADALL